MTKASGERQRRYRRGYAAEWIAAAALMLKGYRVLARRVRTPLGEIDLIVKRGPRLAFVEVKRRATMAECEASITPGLRQRVRRAADMWIARRPAYQTCELSFDVVFVVPMRWPRHIAHGL